MALVILCWNVSRFEYCASNCRVSKGEHVISLKIMINERRLKSCGFVSKEKTKGREDAFF